MSTEVNSRTVSMSTDEFDKRFCGDAYQLIQMVIELRRENENLKSMCALLKIELKTAMEMYNTIEERYRKLK